MPFNVESADDLTAIEKRAVPDAALPAVVTASELYQGAIRDVKAVVRNLLFIGLTMLIARPKAGKSWLTLQLAIYLAGGPPVEGIEAIETGTVVYGAFEEPQSRTKARMRKIAAEGPWTSNLYFVYDLLPLTGGGLEQLAALICKLRPVAVVLDTLTACIKSGSKRDSDVFRSQYNEVSLLRKLAEENSVAIILVHHTRKGVSDGAVEAVAGTGGIAAAVDALWLLKRKPEGEGTLEITGREVEEQTLALRFTEDPFGWQILGDDALQLLNADRRQVLDLLHEEGALTPAQIAAEIGKTRPATRMLLMRMRADGQVTKQGSKYIPSLSVGYRVTKREKE